MFICGTTIAFASRRQKKRNLSSPVSISVLMVYLLLYHGLALEQNRSVSVTTTHSFHKDRTTKGLLRSVFPLVIGSLPMVYAGDLQHGQRRDYLSGTCQLQMMKIATCNTKIIIRTVRATHTATNLHPKRGAS